jgi:hypothetical protein
MNLCLREALLQQSEHGRGEQNVAKLPLLTDKYAFGLERTEILHTSSFMRCSGC